MQHSTNKVYAVTLQELRGLLEGERDYIANTANISSLIFHEINKVKNNVVNWVGFYFVRKNDKDQNELVLGPFHGKVACVRIGFGKGVCGTSYKNKSTIVVKDVHQFPGHIACDESSNSEIVIPIISADGNVLGVFDLDSVVVDTFNEEDKEFLEEIVRLTEKACDWSKLL